MSKSDTLPRRSFAGVWMPLAGIPLLLHSATAQAGDLSIKFFGSESLEFTDNVDNVEFNKDAAAESNTSASVDILMETKTSLLRFTPNISTRGTFFSDSDTKFEVFPGASLEARKTTKNTTYSANASISYSPITSNDLLGEGVLFSQEGNELRYSAGTGISHRLTPIDTLSWNTSFNSVDYSVDSPSLQENSEYGTSLNWRTEISRLTSVDVGTSLTYYDPSGRGDGRSRLTLQPTIGIDTRLTKRLAVGGDIGISLTDEAGSDLNADFLASVNAVYTLNETKLTFALAREVTNAQRGDLVSRYSTSLGLEHQINDRTSFNVSSSYNIEPRSNGPDEIGFLLSPGLNYQLTRDWTSSIRYQLAGTGDTNDVRYANSVFLNLSYGTTLLP